MEESGKAPESDISGKVERGVHAWTELLANDDGGDSSPEIPIKEELVEEVMQELWKEITSPPSPPASFPANAFFAGCDNGNCGPSFSDSSSTVMAGIEMSGANVVGGGVPGYVRPTGDGPGEEVGSPASAGDGPEVVKEREGCNFGGGEITGEKMNGCDGVESDDEWLTRVLSWAPQELEEWL